MGCAVTADRALARMQVLITAPSSLPFSPQVGCPFQLTELTGLRRNDSAATALCGHGVTPCNPSLRPIDRNGARDDARDGAREGGAMLGSSPRPLEWGTHEFGGCVVDAVRCDGVIAASATYSLG